VRVSIDLTNAAIRSTEGLAFARDSKRKRATRAFSDVRVPPRLAENLPSQGSRLFFQRIRLLEVPQEMMERCR